jgi:hypothetical protein
MTNVQSLYALAIADPDYAAFANQNPELRQVTLTREVEAGLARETAALLEQMPERAEQLRRIESSGRREAFDAGMVSIPVLLAVAFLLRTHVRIKRSPGGKWEFLVEQKPADTALIKQVLTRIAQLLPGG